MKRSSVLSECDFSVDREETLFLVRPFTRACETWLKKNVQGEATWLADALAVEGRYIGELVHDALDAGFTVYDK